jgi:hypothetical protein
LEWKSVIGVKREDPLANMGSNEGSRNTIHRDRTRAHKTTEKKFITCYVRRCAGVGHAGVDVSRANEADWRGGGAQKSRRGVLGGRSRSVSLLKCGPICLAGTGLSPQRACRGVRA